MLTQSEFDALNEDDKLEYLADSAREMVAEQYSEIYSQVMLETRNHDTARAIASRETTFRTEQDDTIRINGELIFIDPRTAESEEEDSGLYGDPWDCDRYEE